MINVPLMAITNIKSRVSKFAVENVFNSNATIVVLNSTKTTAINDNEIKKKFSKFQNFITSLDAEPLSFIMKAKNFWSFGLFLGPKAKKGQKKFFGQMTQNCPIQREIK